MKSIKSILIIAIGMIAFLNVSCSNESEQKSKNSFVTAKGNEYLAIPVFGENQQVAFYIDFPSSETQSIDWKRPNYYLDAQRTKPVTLSYWECSAGVFTNGVNTYHYIIVPPGTPNSYLIIDHFSQTVFWVTTAWGGSCGG